jgi:hypothetical protein
VFNAVDRLCDKIKWKGHSGYMDRWFSSPKMFDSLWSCKTVVVGTVILKTKEMPKKVKRYHANGITSCPSRGRTPLLFSS